MELHDGRGDRDPLLLSISIQSETACFMDFLPLTMPAA